MSTATSRPTSSTARDVYTHGTWHNALLLYSSSIHHRHHQSTSLVTGIWRDVTETVCQAPCHTRPAMPLHVAAPSPLISVFSAPCAPLGSSSPMQGFSITPLFYSSYPSLEFCKDGTPVPSVPLRIALNVSGRSVHRPLHPTGAPERGLLGVSPASFIQSPPFHGLYLSVIFTYLRRTNCISGVAEVVKNAEERRRTRMSH